MITSLVVGTAYMQDKRGQLLECGTFSMDRCLHNMQFQRNFVAAPHVPCLPTFYEIATHVVFGFEGGSLTTSHQNYQFPQPFSSSFITVRRRSPPQFHTSVWKPIQNRHFHRSVSYLHICRLYLTWA